MEVDMVQRISGDFLLQAILNFFCMIFSSVLAGLAMRSIMAAFSVFFGLCFVSLSLGLVIVRIEACIKESHSRDPSL
jgi:hypothetical protein